MMNFWIDFWRWTLGDKLEGKMKLFVEALASRLTYEDIETHLEGCLGCGNCGAMCAWYAVPQQPENHPKLKADMLRKVYRRYLTIPGIIMGRLGWLETPGDEFLREASERFFGCCTMCGRCSMACMQGVSNRRLSFLMRQCLTAAGIVPPIIAQIQMNARETRHSFGLPFEECVGKIIAAANSKGFEVKVDRQGAKWLAVCSAIVNTKLPEVAAEVFRLLNAGIDYTLSSRLKDTGTEAFTTVSDVRLGKSFVRDVCEEALRLGCQGIIIGECGCDMRIYNVDAAEIINEYGLQLAYLDGLILDLIKEGKLKVQKLPLTITYHDPCWSARLTGYTELSRELLRLVVDNLVEMHPNRQENYCCNGGAGSMRMWPAEKPGNNLRRQISVLKAEQVRQTGAQVVATPCATCYMSLKDTMACHNVDCKSTMVADLVLEAIDLANANDKERN